MKLGEKLKVTDIKERMKLLIDGEVFYSTDEERIEFANFMFYVGGDIFDQVGEQYLNDNWYYPAKTYTINGVELIDERYVYGNVKKIKVVYISDPIRDDLYYAATFCDVYSGKCERSLVHRTKEAAIAHAKAMIRVEGE